MYNKISDYAAIGNLHSVALIGLDGSIDWLCLPYIDSPSVFGALLDDANGGRFSISPSAEFDSIAEYLPDTNVLTTRFRTRAGVMQLTDFMPVLYTGEGEWEEERQELYRLLEVVRGTVEVEIVFEPRFDYARAVTTLGERGTTIVAKAEGEQLILCATRKLQLRQERCRALWTLSAGEHVWFHLGHGVDALAEINPVKARAALRATEGYWRTWLKKSETGGSQALGHYQAMVDRSALVLKLLYYEPTGTIAAAATTSLPEEIGGVRNWDYRFTWVRDTSFTLQALYNLGHLSETQGYLRWTERLLAEHGTGTMQIMYGLRGERDLPEEELTHLDGYKGSKPVRIGNAAAKQKQLDIYGEIMDAALKLSDYVGKIDAALWPLLRGICDYVVAHWRDRDSGIWEIRGGPYHFVYSKVMCWVALDRGLTIAQRYGFPCNQETWNQSRELIKSEVLEKGWSKQKQSFVQHYETDTLDASNLLIPLMGFLPFDDRRVVSTIEAIHRDLSHGGFLYRYRAQDGLGGEEGTFLLCAFWLIDCLIGLNRLDEAEVLLRRMEGIANHVGLFSEQYDVKWRVALGNFPQAFTHIGFINSVINLCQARGRGAENVAERDADKSVGRLLLSNKILLNDGTPLSQLTEKALVPELKKSMNILRGAFFDTKRGRVAYEQMYKSRAYEDYLKLSYTLQLMDPCTLTTREERLAFWINLYNVIVIHAVIALGVKDSVKEVRNFFRRVQYRVGDLLFTPNDIEHGILRSNRRPPNALFRMFSNSDERKQLVVEPLDPRIHFTLVCASASCPPIEVYTPENLDQELELAGETFLNAGGIAIDRQAQRVSLSRIFRWYRDDFGPSTAAVLRFIAPFLYNESDRKYLSDNAEVLRVEYQEYDWRLNRY
ncbi:MAG: hypothetical protein BMS9Abin10_0521 [Gammaproteobacteria bacterium]|nr:MAG: hypothetical protein BMS9Abin10_0521 [Gammaproteobacteria bacterium]